MKSLLLFATAVCLVCAWYALRVQSATRQRSAIREIEKLGGRAYLDYGDEYETAMDDAPERGGGGPTPMKPWPEWLRKSVGEDFLFSVRDIWLFGKRNLRDNDLAMLTDLGRARRLALHYSSVTDVGFHYAQNLHGLRVLELSHTGVTGSSLKIIANFTDLRTLGLEGTKVNDDSLRHLRKLTNLEQLYLGETQISNEGLVHLAKLTKLTTLGLQSTQIDGRGFKHLEKLPALESLYLSDIQINDASIPLLPKTLRSLKLDGVGVSDYGLRHLEKFPALFQIRLTGSSFTDAAVPYLERVPSLELLILKDTRINDAAIRPLDERGVYIKREK